MNVKLVAVTKPVDLDNAEQLIAYCARVSNPSNQNNHDTAAKLLKYCKDHKHWSPFEMASMVVEIETTRDIARQILRHRSFSMQEFSQRYARVPDLGLRECRKQDPKNRQNSIEDDDKETAVLWTDAQLSIRELVLNTYEAALESGIAKEVARAILPEGMAPTRMYMHGTVRSFIHYCDIRTGPETQKEHRDIANAIQEILYEQFPSLKPVDKKSFVKRILDKLGKLVTGDF